MKTLFILPAMPSDAPFLKYYTDWYTEHNCNFDVACLNRKASAIDDYSSNYHICCQKIEYGESFLKRFVKNYKFFRYVKSLLNKNKYDNVIIFTLPILFFFSRYLVKHFKGKYIIDIRDYSSVYSIGLCKRYIDKALNSSFANCISSEGFTTWLPMDNEYVLSHNVGKDLLNLVRYDTVEFKYPIRILTIGLIRDADSNGEIMMKLANNPSYELAFIGDGIAMPLLKKQAKENNVANVSFYGRYRKEDEPFIVKEYAFINNYMPDNVLSNSLLSNRFYLSVLYGMPMIVREGSVQANLVHQYKLGLVVSPDDDMKTKIQEYCDSFNSNLFNNGRKLFLRKVQIDIARFENVLSKFII